MLDRFHRWRTRPSQRQLLTDIQRDLAATKAAVLLEIRLIRNRMEQIMSNLDNLQAAVDRTGSAVATAVTALVDQRQKIAALQETVNTGQLDQAQLQAMVASLDASTDAVAQALAPVAADPEVPTPAGPDSTATIDVPPAQNPDTADPADVEGSVPAGEPLPDSV